MQNKKAEERAVETIRKRILQLRRDRGWSPEMLCNRARISQDAATRIERGVREPTLPTLARIASAFGVDLAVLVSTGKPPKTRHALTVERVVAILDSQPAPIQRGAEIMVKAFVRAVESESPSTLGGRRRKRR